MIGTLEEMIEDMRNGVYDFTDNGECSSCGQCCSNILPISSKEIKEIRRYIKKHHIKECGHSYPFSQIAFDLTCPFRSDLERKCTIYPVRPAICRCFKCDSPEFDRRKDRDLITKKYGICDMRETFYGKDKP